MIKMKIPRHTGSPCSERDRNDLVEVARSYVGTRWVHLGRSRQEVDCVGLILASIHDVFGVWIEVENYTRWPNENVMRSCCNRALLPKLGGLVPGDVVLLHVASLGVVHMGIFAGRTLIHSSNSPTLKKVVEVTIHPDWKVRGMFAVPEFIK